MLLLKPSNVTPPDGFTFKFQDGHVVRANGRDDWFAKIAKYAIDNGYEIPSHEVAENQLCRRLSGEWCIGGGAHSFINTRFTFDDFLRGTKVLTSFSISGQVVSKEVAEERALICSRCVANVRVPGCSTCNAMANVVMDAKGGKTTKQDHRLEACGVCKCSNQAQVWVPAEFLAKGVNEEMMATYKEIEESDGCWKYREIVDFQSQTA